MPYSQLQAQFPLSSRKFWKKMIEKTVGLLMALFFFEFVAIMMVLVMDNDTGLSNIRTYIPLMLVAGFLVWLLIVFIYVWYVNAYIRRYYYDANEHFVTIKKGVFAPAEIHVQYGKIQDVYVDQDILDRILGIYDVHIASATAASAIEAHIDGVDYRASEGLKELLLGKIRESMHPHAPATMPGAPTTQAPAAPIQFSHEVSTRTYPIAGGWIAQMLVSSFIVSAFYTLFITIFLAIPGKHDNPSLLTTFGFTSDSIISFVFAAFVIIYMLVVAWQFLWRSTFWFEFTPEYVVVRQGVISKSENHLPYRSIQDVSVNQGLIERMFGIATVRIENAAAPIMIGKRAVSSGINIPGQPLEKANHLSEVVRAILSHKSTSQTGL